MKKIISIVLIALLNISQAQISCMDGNNLIVNGDFSHGNTGFTSNYTYSPKIVVPGSYSIVTDPSKAIEFYFAKIQDHTEGTDSNMFIVDIDPFSAKHVYMNTVNVTSNQTYYFSLWAANINNNTSCMKCSNDPPKYENAPQLQFYINNVPVGEVQYIDSMSHEWKQFYVKWTSGLTGSITVSIENANINTNPNGNDLALDDISFSSECEVVTSTSETNYDLQKYIYPNPASNILNIEDVTGDSYSIYTIQGQKIMDSKLINGLATIDVSNYHSGIYILSIKSPLKEKRFSVIIN